MTPPTGSDCPIRTAQAADLPAIVSFEVAIARLSFGAEAVLDPDVHHRRVAPALARPDELTLVAAPTGAPPLGWAWVSRRRNSLTGARYGNFRSLAVAEHPDRAVIGERLMAAVLDWCRDERVTEVVGKVHATNLPMRTLYRAFDFEAVHLSMRRRLPAEGGAR